MNAPVEAATFLTAVDDLGVALQSEDKLNALLSRVEAQARKLVPDLSTDASRGLIRSNAYEVAKSKTAMEKAALALTEDWRAKTKAVNALRVKAVDRLERLKDEVRAPLTQWETEEKGRVARLEAALGDIKRPFASLAPTAAEIEAERSRVEAIDVDETWQEYEDGARRIKADALASLDAMLEVQRKRDAELAELEALRAEKLAREAALLAEAEAKAAAERKQAQETAEAERQAKLASEREEAAARAAEAAKVAAERAAQEKIDAAERARKEADERAAAAVETERQRAAEASRQEAAALAKRAADDALRAAARAAIFEAVDRIGGQAADADALTDALMEGRIPHMVFRP